MKRSIVAALVKWKSRDDRKPLLLRGARQVGKTFILKQFGKDEFPAVHYLNFEEDPALAAVFDGDLRPNRILSELQFHFDRTINTDCDLLILDEIQQCPRALTCLKYFQEECPQLAVCAAGSLLGVQLSSESFPVGKVDSLTMHPMSFAEFLLAMDARREFDLIARHDLSTPLAEVAHRRLWDYFRAYLVVGGLPAVVAAYAARREDAFLAFNEARQVQGLLVTGYLADMAKHAGKENSMHLDRVWRSIPAQLARTQDGSAPKFVFKGVVPGIKGYSRLAGAIDWLLAAGLVVKMAIVERADIPFSAFADESVFKLYGFDVGILGALGGLPPKAVLDYDFGTFKGYMAENFVAQEFVCNDSGPLYAWRGRTSEVEFVREHQGQVLPIEVKSGFVTRSKSLGVFMARYACPRAVILSGHNVSHSGRVSYFPLYLASRYPFE